MENEIVFDNKRQVVTLKKELFIQVDHKLLFDQVEQLFTQLNYKRITRGENEIECHNGQANKNGWHNNPLKWENQFQLNYNNGKLELLVKWSIKHQIVTKHEQNFIIQFIDRFITDLENGKMELAYYAKESTKTVHTGRKMTIYILFTLLLITTVMASLTFYFENITFILGIPVGAVLAFILINKQLTKSNSQHHL